MRNKDSELVRDNGLELCKGKRMYDMYVSTSDD